ncbi:hypothetical protein ACIQ9P_11420 [Kitasatospora sp. NPDC094019]|uniref:hypothetical protein n=1 Tax=Kitasatospora sp. NPDC094019 TaxID=3364091 RepID=UPI00381A8924
MSDDRPPASGHEPDGAGSDSQHPDPEHPDPECPDPEHPEPVRPEAVRPEPVRPEPPRPGPHGDGPRGNRSAAGGAGVTAPVGGESPMERLLREALAARAARITAQDLRPADPPKGPRNRRRPAYLVGLPLMGLAAAMVVGVLTVPSDTLADKGDDAPAATMSDGPQPTRGGDGASPTGFAAPPADGTAGPVGEADRATAGGPPPAPGAGTGPVPPGEQGDVPAAPGAGAGAPVPPPGGAGAGAQSAPPPPVAPAPAPSGTVRPGGGVTLSFDGLAGTEAIVGAGPTTFSVTWRNTTQRPYDAVAPVVSVRTLTGTVRSGRSVRGRLQREEEGGGWTDVPLTVGSGAYLASGDAAAFPLAAGAVRTVRYRLDPAIDSAEGTLLIEALAVLSTTPERYEEGSALAPLLLTSAPAASRTAPELRITSTPSDGVIAGRPSYFSMTISNPGAAPLASVVPTLVLTGADAAKVVVETRYGGGAAVRRLPVAPDGNGQLVVDTSLLERLMRPRDSKYLEFQLSVPEDWRPDADFAMVVGARGDGRDAAPVVLRPRFVPAAADL